MIPSNFVHFTGKANLIASFNHYLLENIMGGFAGEGSLPSDKEFYWRFNYPIVPEATPAITTAELGLFNVGEIALDQLVSHREDGVPIYGTKNQTLFEITCIDQDRDNYTSATQKVYNLRDRIIHALSTDTIPLRNYADPSIPQVGIIYLDPESNSVNEKFVVDSVNQQVKRVIIIVRLFWVELIQVGISKTLTSDTKII